jgi:adenosylcobinamide kinase/adenosylcobinamide-phosphate guanylyltransferase
MMMGKLVLVTGGARSGKSTYAERIAGDCGNDVLYVATAVPVDVEMRDRIQKHRRQRPARWSTFEGYRELKRVYQSGTPWEAILVDCVTVMITNLLFEQTGEDVENLTSVELAEMEEAIHAEFREFLDEAVRHPCPVIMVANEVGFGIVPENKMARIFRDIAGRVNQYIASRADEVYLVVCGIPVKIK